MPSTSAEIRLDDRDSSTGFHVCKIYVELEQQDNQVTRELLLFAMFYQPLPLEGKLHELCPLTQLMQDSAIQSIGTFVFIQAIITHLETGVLLS
jgi:hypothetical protein